MPPLVDEETRRLLLQKTWCHGQLVLPVFAVWYLVLFFQGSGRVYLVAAIILPTWSYYSWRSINHNHSNADHHTNETQPNAPTSSSRRIATTFPAFLVGGILVELAHLSVLLTAVQDISSSTNLFLVIASGLFLVETAAFMAVVGMCRRPHHSTDDAQYNQIL